MVCGFDARCSHQYSVERRYASNHQNASPKPTLDPNLRHKRRLGNRSSALMRSVKNEEILKSTSFVKLAVKYGVLQLSQYDATMIIKENK